MNRAVFLEKIKNIPFITKQNIALLLEQRGANLDYWTKTLVEEGLLISLKQGFYVPKYYYDLVSESPARKEQYLMYLANNLRSPSYVSLEYVLSKNNMIAESTFAITSITLKSTRSYQTPIGAFIYRNVQRELYFGYRLLKFQDKEIREASRAKALCDYLYLRAMGTPEEMKQYLLETSRLNWNVLDRNDKKEFKKTIAVSDSRKMSAIEAILENADIL